jgi:hypothetical protein
MTQNLDNSTYSRVQQVEHIRTFEKTTIKEYFHCVEATGTFKGTRGPRVFSFQSY